MIREVGSGLRHTSLALPSCCARRKHEAELRAATPRFSCRYWHAPAENLRRAKTSNVRSPFSIFFDCAFWRVLMISVRPH